MPVFPGDRIVEIKKIITENEIQLSEICLNVHTGTHVDCPIHFFKEHESVSSLSPERFYGKAFVADCTNINKSITPEFFEIYNEKLISSDFVLFYTGWDKHWGSNEYYTDFPVLSEKMAKILSASEIKGIGFDTPSVDPVDSEDEVIHKIILGSNKIIIENLKNLNSLLNVDFSISCYPLKIDSADGSPVRAVAYI